MTAPTRFLNYSTRTHPLTHLPGRPDVPPRPYGPDSFGGLWKIVTVDHTETGIRVGLLPHSGNWPPRPQDGDVTVIPESWPTLAEVTP